MSTVSWTVTRKPAASRCSTHFLQQPHVEVLYTMMSGGGAGVAMASPATAAPASASARTPCLFQPVMERSEEHTSNSSHSQISYAVFCLKKKKDLPHLHTRSLIRITISTPVTQM